MQEDMMPSYQPFPVNIEEALELAHVSEVLAKRMYLKISGLSATNEVVELSKRLALMEEGHANAIAKMFSELTGKAIGNSEDILPETTAEISFESVDSLLKEALEKEKDSYLFYISLSNSSRDEKIIKVLRKLAKEEKEHQEAIKRLLK
jgi:rubrerythrin